MASEYDDTIDLLLTGLMMPRMTGKRLAHRVQTLYPALKVVFVSGYDGDQVPQENGATEGSAMLQKPFKLSYLIGAVGQALASPSRR